MVKATMIACAIVHEPIEVSTITKDLSRTLHMLNRNTAQDFVNSGVAKEGGQEGNTFLGPGLGGASTHFAVI